MPTQTVDPNQDERNPAARQEGDLTDFDAVNQRAKNEGNVSGSNQAGQREADRNAIRDQLAAQEGRAAVPKDYTNDLGGIRRREGDPEPSDFTTDLGNSGGGGGGRFFGSVRNRWLVGGLISLLLSSFVAMANVPQALLIYIKEVASNWMDKNSWNSNSRRFKKIAKKWFKADPNCKSGVKCRMKSGVTEPEIEHMKAQGLDPEVEKVGDKSRVKSFGGIDANGDAARITPDGFEKAYNSNVRFRAALDNVFDARDGLNRGSNTRKVYKLFGVKRQKFSNTNDPKEAEKDFRKTIYSGEGQDIDTKPGSCPGGNDNCQETDAEKTQREGLERQLGDAYSEIKNGAAQVRADLEGSNYEKPPSVTPNMSFMDMEPSKLYSTLSKTVKGAMGAVVKGVYAIAEKACAILQFIRTIAIGGKIFMMFGLIKYALMFMTMADSLKAGDGNYAIIAFVMSMFLRPSVEEGSKGKTFFDSPFMGLMTEGKINDRQALGRFTAGTPPLRLFNELNTFLGRSGVGVSSCRQVNSWYGQLFGIITGVATLIFTGGTVNLAAVAGSVSTQILLSVLSSYMIPIMIGFVAGTVAPDPKDPQGGYGLGSALASGLALFRHQRSKSGGDRPLLQAERAQINQEANQEVAFATKAAHYGRNPFSMSEPDSITSKIAMAIAPYVLAPTSSSNYQNLAMAVTSPFSMVSSSLGKILSPAVNAQDSQDGYGGQFCTDSANAEIQLAVDAYCVPLDGEKAAKLEGKKYDPQVVDDYMVDRGHVDPDTGEPKSDEYKSFVADCFEGVVPITADGRGVDITEDVDTQKCLLKDEHNDLDKGPGEANYDGEGVQADMFRMFRKSNGLHSEMKEESEGTLGVGDEGTSNSGGGVSGPLNPGAFTWPVAPSSISTISSCMNQTDPSYRLHAGTDIAAPQGSTIVAVADGQVVFESKTTTGFEYYIAIKHANGSITGYGHNLENLVKQGDTVKQGQPIAKVGSRGQSTGPHVHLNYIPSGNSTFTNSTNAFNPLFDNLMPKPADVKDQAGCLTPQKLKPR
jgi:hypothetical protein